MLGQSLLIHLPIALLIVSVGLDLVGLARHGAAPQRAALPLLAAGLAGSLISAVTGFQEVEQSAASTVSLHQLWAIATLVVFGGLLALRLAAHRGWSPRLRGMYIAFAITGILTLAITGFYGAELLTGFVD